MKIAFIGQKGIPVTFGGVEYHVDRLSRELAKQGHLVRVYVRNWYTPKSLSQYQGVTLTRIFTLKSKHLDAALHSFLCSLHVLFIRVDVIHYHCLGPSLFSFIPRLFGKKVVSTVHRLDWASDKWGFTATMVLKIGEWASAKFPHHTIVVSRELQKYLLAKYRTETTHITHGIDFENLCSSDVIRKKYGFKGRDYLLFMGRLVPEKRVDWIIRAYIDLNKKSMPDSIDIGLVIAGGSSATDEYVKRLKEMGHDQPGIFFPGYVTGQEKLELLSNSLLFILPSSLEGYPIVLMEAMSYGVCCLASNIPPHRESIRHNHNGVLFDSECFDDFYQQLKSLLEDRKRIERIGKAALEKMKRYPSWESVTRQTLSVYDEIIRKKV